MGQWFSERGIRHWWSRQSARDSDVHRAIYYKFNLDPISTARTSAWVQAYKGIFLQSLWSVTDCEGRLLPTCEANGGEFHTEGVVFCTPSWEAAMYYAWPTILFNDGLFHGAILDIVYDNSAQLSRRNQLRAGRPNHELFLQPEQLQVRGMWIVVDKSVDKGDPRFYAWKRELEILPPGRTRPANPAFRQVRLLDVGFD